MNRVSDRRQEILAFINSQIDAKGRRPTDHEIATACGFKSLSAVRKHVRHLEESGELEASQGRPSGIEPKRAKEQAPGAAVFFEVSPRDIGDLTDVDLRALIARLCIAGLADAGIPATSVIWGGDQRAPDGGIDVRVQTPPRSDLPAPFDRGALGIQVKATRMGPAEIQREMCPGGVLRPSIIDLIAAHGGYIIAASDLVADEEYQRRVTTISTAASSVPEAAEAMFDYYDARRIADWTNQHPGVVAWARSRLGRPLQGWQSFGPWTAASDDRGEFFADEQLRVSDPLDHERKLSLVEGLAQVRRKLRVGGNSVRLTGLSGVGKTRFAQALFEEDALEDALPACLAVYTDTGHSPVPSPLLVLDELLAARRRTVLIIDNCGSQLHNELSARCRSSSNVNLLTIEYDIREELANESSVFQLGAGSADLIERVIAQQFPSISEVSRGTIARFADGNSRVAIALAHTMERHDSLAGLNDDELFDRLFWLGKEVNHELKIAAEACSLVYSFDVDDLEGELTQLANLAGITPLTLFRHVGDLEQRGLVQRRGRWRALLPHAVANRLAARALISIPKRMVELNLVKDQERLMKSFSRRLGYLHRSPHATSIAREWLLSSELLNDWRKPSELQIAVLENIAPIDPAATLDAIRRAVNGEHGQQLLTSTSSAMSRMVHIVRLIAFDADLFDSCLALLLQIALTEPESRSAPTSGIIKYLFQMYLSGTHASTEQRLEWVWELLASSDSRMQSIGIDALSSALDYGDLSPHGAFEFGARVRDYGADPRDENALCWIRSFVGVAVEIGTSGGPMEGAVRDVLALRFRSLWTIAGALDPLEAAVTALAPGGWERGWLAIRQTLRLDGKSWLSSDSYARLVLLEGLVSPTTLVGRVKAIVLNDYGSVVDYAKGDSETQSYERANDLARELGVLVAADDEALMQIAPLVVTNVQGRQSQFGEGLGSGTPHAVEAWRALVDAFERTPLPERNVQVLSGFLKATSKHDHDLSDQFLDGCIVHLSLAEWVPLLQLSVGLDDRGCDRLLESIADPNVPSRNFRYLSYGRPTENVPEVRLAALLQKLSTKPGGVEVAIDILRMHVYGPPKQVGPELTSCARSLIANAPLAIHGNNLDHSLSALIERFLVGPEAHEAALAILDQIHISMGEFTISRYDFNKTLNALFSAQAELALDVLVGDEVDPVKVRARRNVLAAGRSPSALVRVSEDVLLHWCRAGSANRWIHVAHLIPALDEQTDDEDLKWSNHAKLLLTNAPNSLAVADALIDTLLPMSWSGSRAEVIRKRLPLLEQLPKLLGPVHSDKIATWRRHFTEEIERETRYELEEHRSRNERFE